MQLKNAEVLAIPPVNAWVIIADEDSEPTLDELNDRFAETEPGGIWTGPPQARVGDLLIFHFKKPLKAVRYVARVAADPFFDSESDVNSVGEVSKHQWWIRYTPLVPVPEVTFQEFAAMHSGHLVLRGRSGKYVSPDVVRQLIKNMKDRVTPDAAAEFDSVLKVPLGDPDLPPPAAMTLAQWSAMADGAFTLEAKVEDYVVEPLLRFALAEDSSLKVQRQYPAEKGKADWGVVRAGRPTAVVETKIGVGEPGGGDRWMDSPAFAQLRRYMDVHDVPGLLIDARRMMLVDPGAVAPSRVIDRRTTTAADIVAIGEHLGASATAVHEVVQAESDVSITEAIVPVKPLPTAKVRIDDNAQNGGVRLPIDSEPLSSEVAAPANQVLRTEPESGAWGLTQFVPAHTNIVGSRDVLDALPCRQDAATVRDQVKDVIESEGPIEVGRLARVVARRFGLNAVNAARAKDITKLVPKDQLLKSPLGVFAWPASLDPNTWDCVRLIDSSGSRSFDEIAPQEIANVMDTFYREYPKISDEDALRRTAEFFGIVRISANVRSRLTAVQEKVANKKSMVARLHTTTPGS